MKVRAKRYLSMLLVACMCLSLMLSIQFPVMAAYENTHHNTGNQAYDIVEVAKTQLGYTEGSSKDNKYGATFGVNNADWCAFFVSWCAKEAGISTSIIKRQGIASPFSKYFNIPNTHGSSEDYFPKPGDLVFYAQDGGSHYHVGIVETVNKATGKITTIEGNSYQKSSESKNPHYVCRHTISYNASNVCCYGTPNYTGTTLPTEHTCDYGTFAYYGAAHPHYNYYYCSICGAVNCNTGERTSLLETCGDCFVHDGLLSCNYGTYVYYEATHPHYNCYACSTCGKISRKTSETNYISSCLDCNRPGKPEITSLQACYVEGDTITFGWTSTDNTTHYNFWLYVKNDQNAWETYEHTFYATSGFERMLPIGEYRFVIQSYNSNYWNENGTDWLYTESDYYYFSIVDLEDIYSEKPVISDMKTIYADDETIICDWQDFENVVLYALQVYEQNSSGQWDRIRYYTIWPSQSSSCTMDPLPVGKYRCYLQVNCDNPMGDGMNSLESDYYYFDVVPAEEIVSSVNLSGSITSFGAADGAVTVRLKQGGVVVANVISTNGTYCLENVVPGDYILEISKVNHVTRTYSLTVTDTNVTLDVKIHLIGDIDGNGKVNTGDVAKLNAHLKGTNKLTDEYQILCANVNGGSLNMGDTAALYGHIKGTKKLY